MFRSVVDHNPNTLNLDPDPGRESEGTIPKIKVKKYILNKIQSILILIL